MQVRATVEVTLWFEVDDSKDLDGLREELEGELISTIHEKYEVSAEDELVINVEEA